MAQAECEYTIRIGTKNEVSLVSDWAAVEKWDANENDVRLLQEVDPEAILVGEYQGEVIACITGFKYDETYAYISYYMVKPEFRGQGFGLPLFRACLERLQACAVVSLHAIPGREQAFRHAGFTHTSDCDLKVYRGEGTKDESLQTPQFSNESWSVVSLQQFSRHEDIVEYDTESQACSAPRGAMLGAFLKNLDGFVATRTEAGDRQGRVIGYGFVDKKAGGFGIGPLVADSQDVAASLLTAFRSLARPDQTLTMGVPSSSTQSVELAEAAGFQQFVRVQRMSTARPAVVDFDKLYAAAAIGVRY